MIAWLRAWPWWAKLGLAGAVLAMALPLLFVARSGNDELNQLAQAWRVAQGDRLYQEVWEFAAPLPIAVAALVFKLWGAPSLDLARLLAFGVMLANLLGLLALCRRLALSPWASALAALALALGSLPGYRAYYHHWWALACLWGALALAWRALDRAGAGAWRFWLGAGFLAGLSGLCTQSIMPVALAALGVAWLAAWPKPWRAGSPCWSAAGALAAGVLLPWALACAAFSLQGGAGAMLHQLWVWPALHYRVAGGFNEVWPFSDFGDRYLPMWQQAISPWWWLVWVLGQSMTALVPLLAGLGAALALVGRLLRLRARPWGPQGQGAAVLAVATLLVGFFALRGRADWAHLAIASPLGALAWAWWAHQGWALAPKEGSGPRLAAAAPALAMAAWVALCGAHELRSFRQAWRQDQVALGLTARLEATPLIQALRALPAGHRLWAFPSSGAAYLLGGGRHMGRFGLLMPTWARYQGPEEFAAFREDWAAHPPDAVLLVGRDGAKAVAEWGDRPSLVGYRRVGVYPGMPGEELIPHELWVRQEPGASASR